ncbi:hypothetical protein E3T55_16225 [Cryobacterium frigoriphilum]|uniref:Uncharacterized protein n=1 Tax=Cryobacterium frigoriphilum TaxID=1259150 RepID=A0A4R8ZV47_9MICO|nr:hypothetical protein [Cryobacterium frigoriphilum]TFD46919.1 hypothetical protein E3T55_16225 [Cryobacterium frigoriphilum]
MEHEFRQPLGEDGELAQVLGQRGVGEVGIRVAIVGPALGNGGQVQLLGRQAPVAELALETARGRVGRELRLVNVRA